jgi:three-Cys-motif partner protein
MRKHTDLGVEERFFDHPRESSRIKQKVVVDYFLSWTNVLARNRTVGYADLFAGPGQYKKNREKSIPILITERVIQDERLRTSVKLWFNEGDPNYASELEQNILMLPGVESLQYKPVFTRKIVDKSLAQHRFSIPTLVFADPCGYKGLSLRLMASALQGFGNDCIFFFNYRRVNMKLSYPVMDESIDEFFEPDRAKALRREIESLQPRAREDAVLNAIRAAIREAGGIPIVFAFRSREGGGTSHHLVFASKDKKGAGIMKRIMNACSSEVIDGVGSWEFAPKDSQATTLPLFSPLQDVCDRLLQVFSGRTLTFSRLLDEEAPATQYTDGTYRDAVLRLEAEFRIEVDLPAQQRRMQAGSTKRTLPEGTKLTFPT